MSDHRPQEARAHLLSLWEKEPGDGTLNLELARLAVVWGDTPQAIRYYHAAIYGVWPDNPAEHRLQIRFELSEYLLQHHTVLDAKDAQAELVALAAELPPQDAFAQTRLGTLLVQAGLYARALAAFRNALRDRYQGNRPERCENLPLPRRGAIASAHPRHAGTSALQTAPACDDGRVQQRWSGKRTPQ